MVRAAHAQRSVVPGPGSPFLVGQAAPAVAQSALEPVQPPPNLLCPALPPNQALAEPRRRRDAPRYELLPGDALRQARRCDTFGGLRGGLGRLEPAVGLAAEVRVVGRDARRRKRVLRGHSWD